MILNEGKYVLFTHKHHKNSRVAGVEYTTSGGAQISPSEHVRDLGIKVSGNLSWRPHLVDLAERGRCMALWVFGVFSNREPELMVTVYKTLVRSLMEYCSPLWSPQTVGNIQLLESVQRSFTAKISGMKNLDYWQRLKALDLMSLQRRRVRYAVLTGYNHAQDIPEVNTKRNRYQLQTYLPRWCQSRRTQRIKGEEQTHQNTVQLFFRLHRS